MTEKESIKSINVRSKISKKKNQKQAHYGDDNNNRNSSFIDEKLTGPMGGEGNNIASKAP